MGFAKLQLVFLLRNVVIFQITYLLCTNLSHIKNREKICWEKLIEKNKNLEHYYDILDLEHDFELELHDDIFVIFISVSAFVML